MPQSKTPERNSKRRDSKRHSKAAAKETGAASSPAAAQSGDPAVALTLDDLIQGLDKVRRFAISQNRTVATVNATIALARLLRFLPDAPGRPPSSRSKAGPAAQFKFDGNYHNAARRIALLLQLGKKVPANGGEEPEGGDRESGKDDRTDT
jgi:hypothetical protein